MQTVEEGDQIETILGIILGRRDPEPGIRYGIVFAGMCLCVFDRARMEVVANELRIWKGLGHQHGGPAVTAPDIGHLGGTVCRRDPSALPSRAQPRDANSARFRKSFQPGRDVHRIAEEIVALYHDIADVDADAEPHLLTSRSIRILLGYDLLHSDGTFHSIHGTGEIGDEAIACRGEDPTATRGDEPIDNGPVSCQSAEGADLIPPHQTAIAFDIGGEDRGELSFDGWRFQPRHLPNFEYRPTSCEIRGVLSHSEARW